MKDKWFENGKKKIEQMDLNMLLQEVR